MNSTRAPWWLKPHIYIVLAIIVVCGVLLYRTYISSQTGAPGNDGVAHDADEQFFTASLWLETVDGRTIYSTGEQFAIDVYADSAEQPVTGYDVLFPITEGSLELVDAESLIVDMEVSTSSDEASISVSGFKAIQAEGEIVFAREPIVRLTFKPRTSGSIDLPIAFKTGETADSNIVVGTQDTLGSVESLSIDITNNAPITLREGMSRVVHQDGATTLTLTLTMLTSPNAACADCPVNAEFEITTNQPGIDPVAFTLQLGGITGPVWTQTEVAGLRIAAVEGHMAPDPVTGKTPSSSQEPNDTQTGTVHVLVVPIKL